MTDQAKHALEILPGYPADVVAIEAVGHVTRADYEEVLIPAVLATAKAEGKVKLLYLIGARFAGLSLGAAWDDAKLGLLHMGDFARVAVVSDVDWIRVGLKMFAPFMPCPVHVFHTAELAAAKDWITAADVPRKGRPGVDVTHKLPLAEDKMPPNP
ncbi:MAG: STAS/SEC14 domain-containing protein [Paracoccaceae bacterium]|nr:STAS/SEC14 domain-containing protein [Paracoccaceae bacterium]MDE3120369.1 STAS/SEC14 domain-containing protein [Paracoccaceae bacterium]MDE3238516.1 STAS/SEC14 domain-containing protein [Paracoccaceae bacterium]